MTPITLLQYFGAIGGSAKNLLDQVNALLEGAEAAGVKLHVDPDTGCYVSGNGRGGFRLQDCPEGARLSSHKTAQGIDISDPKGALDAWITDAILEKHGLYREHPDYTIGWCHLTTRAPGSKRRSFIPG